MNDAYLRAPARSDAGARARALDVGRSFIVRAPAGSGKTGLLIQRYLSLLTQVDEPEAIIAMTFTRKAAAEIRERVIEALRAAAAGDAEPVDAHERTTWRLARAVLTRDRERDWSLGSHPARLRIHTIDALCASLMRQAPLATGVGVQPRLVDDASALYADAARATLRDASAGDAAWRLLLLHLDNDATRAVALLADLFARRGEWAHYLVGADPLAFRSGLQDAITKEAGQVLARLRERFDADTVRELVRLAGPAGAYLAAKAGAATHTLQHIAERGALPDAHISALPHWCALADWLLTKGGTLRVQVGAAMGFPSSDTSGHGAAMSALLDRLRATRGLAPALAIARTLPTAELAHADWALLDALIHVLPGALAHLRVAFAREGAIDFVEATQIALKALGGAEAPSDLLIAADMRIAHWLVDEFQDTSRTQCRLLEQLTAGWSEGDGRTLFLVGDPMQSIYRFRQADVERFNEAWRERRLGSVMLEPITVERNFRSGPRLVEWVNRTFGRLPQVRDDTAESVAFTPASAASEASVADQVTVDIHGDARAEALAVVQRVTAALDVPAHSIAILVRKRSDLDVLLPALRAARIAFAAVGLEKPEQRPAVQDLLSLAHALLQPADRLAWGSLLRAPWCGMKLSDLLALKPALTQPPSLLQPDPPGAAGLSEDGRVRLSRLRDTLATAWSQRGRVAPAAWVRGAWLSLGGPAIHADPLDATAAEAFFAALEAHTHGGDVPDWQRLLQALSVLPLEPEPALSPRVQVMTLHKAKGLEFDVVLMPALDRGPGSGATPLLRLRERAYGLLAAPGRERAPGADRTALHEYLRRVAQRDEAAELDRLLYVGCTRARHGLHLSGVLPIQQGDHGPAWKSPRNGSALEALWPVLAPDVAPPRAEEPQASGAVATGVPLRRLSRDWRLPATPAAIPVSTSVVDSGEQGIAFDWARERARQLGIAAHILLQRIASDGVQRWDPARLETQRSPLTRIFASAGFDNAEATAGAAEVVAALQATLDDPRGRWLLDNAHADAARERAITAVIDDALVHVVLDRTFVDAQGVRWIVDFKLSGHEGGDLDVFLDREQERYASQLERYAQAMQALDPRPIRLGLYFPRLSGWREWGAGG
jgi:ATP-dependent exoDNAse (exonuclease V) beta subunit